METVEKIGIMGGTFNPIHNGHLMLAQCAYRQFHLDRILVIPNRLPVYKESKELLAPDLRSEMIRLAIKDYPYMRFSDIELKRSSPTYSIDTIRELHRLYPNARLYFIIGGDSLTHFREWREYSNLLRECAFLCAPRPGADFQTLYAAREKLLQEVPEGQILFLNVAMMDISSTEIRNAIREHQSTAEWIPAEVRTYIDEHQLYSTI